MNRTLRSIRTMHRAPTASPFGIRLFTGLGALGVALLGAGCPEQPGLGDVPGTVAVVVCDTRGDPAAGINLQATDPQSGEKSQQSDSEGRAELSLSPETYEIRIRGGGPDRAFGGVRVEGNGSVTLMDEQCIGPRQLPQRGAVSGDLCNRHVGAWVGGARVALVASTGERRTVFTDDEGHFLMQNIPVGTATLKIRGPGPYVRTVTVDVAERRVNWITPEGECRPLGPNDVCTDADDDGYGAGADCIAEDCNDGEPAQFEACLDELPSTDNGAETPPVLLLPRIEVTPGSVDFTGLVPNMARSAQLTIRNLGTGPLRFDSISLAGTDAQRFILGGVVPTALLPDDSFNLQVNFFAQAVGTFRADVVILSNDDLSPEVRVPLRAEVGVPPGFVISPPACERRVGVGRPGICEYNLLNTADHPISLTVVAMDPGSDPGFTVENLQLPRSVGAGTAVTVRVIKTPELATTYEGILQVASNEGQNLTAIVRVVGTGDPTAVIDVQSIAGVPTPAGTNPQVRPLDDVVLTAARSSAPPGRSLVSRQWRLVSRPTESTVVLLTPTGPTTAFAFNSSGQTRRGLDVAGTFVVGLTVTDSLGDRSAEATITLQAVPSLGVTVQLTWDHPSADMDLHLVRNGGNFRSADDCHFGNCRTGLNWGGGEANPSLDVDDTDGFGPETITMDDPAAGTYRVMVHFWASHGSPSEVPCIIKVYLGASLAREYRRTLTREGATGGDVWQVADIIVPGSTLSDVDDVFGAP